eukprot:CAMPEP_0117038142 /NCGR_PEP_ID=MMETSP0472-20121206/26863_1 /TAXON_ID=693140 ORGANISM="Tiarina fusus, Strain LIS" /NCGR_SAMPLE_ID=MMETSP0472 /ASSEMBLY_ACC=CAM_ASM_000603 /LENGTH=72 /DNA_ID=CAMNT_0004748297 /DNA_START=356 /DNA_END=574 /DNA_ORIENTATION=+
MVEVDSVLKDLIEMVITVSIMDLTDLLIKEKMKKDLNKMMMTKMIKDFLEDIDMNNVNIDGMIRINTTDIID